MPLCPQITNTPITVVNSTDFIVTSVFPVVPATTEQVNDALELAQDALDEAALAFAASANAIQISSNTIVNASNQMTAMNTNGITVYAGSSPSSGARVVMNSAGIAGFNTSGTATFAISASTGNVEMTGALFTGGTISGGSLNIAGNAIINSSGFLTATGATITGTLTSSDGTIGGFSLSSNGLTNPGSTLQIFSGTSGLGSIYALYTSKGVLSRTLQTNGGTVADLVVGGGATFGTSAQFLISSTGDINSNLNCNFEANIQGELRAVYAQANTVTNAANVWISSTGQIRRTTASSLRYKENVVDLVDVSELHPRKLLDIPVRAFTYKTDHLSETNDRAETLFPGFIAEEVDQFYPIAADYEDGDIESWNDRIMIPGMLALIQDLYKEIALLKGE